jgi:MoxR-like ATPase
MPEGTQNILLSAMDEKSVLIPKFGRVEAKDGFMLIATQNPDEYIGTSQLSEALKDRFICVTLLYQSEEEEKEIVRLRSKCPDDEINEVAVNFVRLTRVEKELRRGSSIRGAIDLADIFFTAFGSFNDDKENWVKCAKLALLTKIELHDPSNEKLLEMLDKLVSKALTTPRGDPSSDTTAFSTMKSRNGPFVVKENKKKTPRGFWWASKEIRCSDFTA